MLPVREFYARSRWRDQWNILRPDGTRHRGHDIGCSTHEEVPALRGGIVIAVSRSSVLGNYVVVDVLRGGYDFYCHLLSGGRPQVGAELSTGSKVGLIAGPNDFHGSAWSGVHLHFGTGPATFSVVRGITGDATALIKSVLASPAGGAPTPLPFPPTEETSMTTHYLALTTSKNGMIGKNQRFAQEEGRGPLRVLGAAPLSAGGEWGAISYGRNLPVVSWSGDQIAELVRNVGLYEYSNDGPSGVGRLTGRILYDLPKTGSNVYDPRATAR